MPEPTHAEKVEKVRVQAQKALASRPLLLAQLQGINFDRISPADLTNLENQLGGRVT